MQNNVQFLPGTATCVCNHLVEYENIVVVPGGDEEMTDNVINTNIIELYNNGMLKLHRLEEAMNLKLQHFNLLLAGTLLHHA